MGEVTNKAVINKVAWRLIPFLFLLYIINILDRVNLGFARLQLVPKPGTITPELELGITEEVFALGAGIFYIGYFVFEVPSNLILRRTGARRWISRIMISWGAITCATMAITGPWGLYVMRILLGFAEAGFFPGIILYLTYWFPARERARAVAWFMIGSPIAGILGQPLSGAIMQFLNDVGGLRGWQWLFLLEGIPAIILGVIVLRYLTDRPDKAQWLSADERAWLVDAIGQEEQDRERRHGLTLMRAMADARVWLLIGLYFTVAAGSNTLGFYMPKLIDSRFQDLDTFTVGLLAAVPSVFAMGCMIINGTHSDRTGERRWHVAVPAFAAAAGWLLLAVTDSPWSCMAGLVLAQAGVLSTLPVFWSMPTAFLSGVAAAGGIALINSVGNLGGFAGVQILGQLYAVQGSFTDGLTVMASILFLGGVLALCVRPDTARR